MTVCRSLLPRVQEAIKSLVSNSGYGCRVNLLVLLQRPKKLSDALNHVILVFRLRHEPVAYNIVYNLPSSHNSQC